MKFAEKLIKGSIIANYKNIILDVSLGDGSVVPAFCYEADRGNVLYTKGTDVWLSFENSAIRKIKYEVQIVKNSGGMVFVNPNYTEELFLEALQNGVVEDLKEYNSIKKVSTHENLRYVQFELTKPNGEALYITTGYLGRKEGGYVVFPTDLNLLELKIIEEFRLLREKGHKTAAFFVVPRQDTLEVKFSWSIDQIAAAKVYDEAKNGLKFFFYGCKVSPEGIEVDRKMNIIY